MRFFFWIISGEFRSCFSTAFDKNFHLILNVRISVYKYTHTWLKFTFPDSSFNVAKAGHKEATTLIYFVISRCILNIMSLRSWVWDFYCRVVIESEWSSCFSINPLVQNFIILFTETSKTPRIGCHIVNKGTLLRYSLSITE